MKIAIACDHGAFDLKNKLVTVLTDKGYEVRDFGTYSADSCDYPDYIAPAARAVAGSRPTTINTAISRDNARFFMFFLLYNPVLRGINLRTTAKKRPHPPNSGQRRRKKDTASLRSVHLPAWAGARCSGPGILTYLPKGASQ